MGRRYNNNRSRRDAPYENRRDVPTLPLWNFEVDVKASCVATSPTDDVAAAATATFESLKDSIPTAAEEVWRAGVIAALREKYIDICQDVLGCKPRKESFNRWLFEMLSDSDVEGEDVVFRHPEKVSDSKVLSNDLIEAWPCVIHDTFDNARHLKTVADEFMLSVHRWLDRGGADAEAAMAALKETLIPERPDPFEFTANCKAVRATLRDAFANEMAEVHRQLIDATKVKLAEKPSKEEFAATEEPVITGEGQLVTITYADKEQKILTSHYTKLKELYSNHCQADTDLKLFPRALFTLLQRYQSFFGPHKYQGASFHAAAPENVFEYLHREFSVSQELFASPLNCYFRHFCSAFPDIDMFFGSRGSCFNFTPAEGSFEVGPPYTLEVMDETARYLDRQLEEAEKAGRGLSFIVFVPIWKDEGMPIPFYHEHWENQSRFTRSIRELGAKDYRYIAGSQFTSTNRYWRCTHATAAYLLQNKQGQQYTGDDAQTRQKMDMVERLLREA